MPHRLVNPSTARRALSPGDAAQSGLARSVTSGARLHFGLFSTSEVGGRTFGGVGMMVDEPSTHVVARPAKEFHVRGDEAALLGKLARRIAAHFARAAPPIELSVLRHAPRHAGLGSGTQLAMCVALQLAAAWKLKCDPAALALAAGRGERSGIGVHGFELGGLLADGGKAGESQLAPLVERIEVPQDWRVLLIWPHAEQESPSVDLAGASGSHELQAFSRLSPTPPQLANALRQEASDVLLPAARQQDFQEFAASVSRFNRLAGECFVAVQGGVYASPAIERLIGVLQANGVAGVGQSSWGPVVFACCESDAHATELAQQLREGSAFAKVRPAHIAQTRPRNTGYQAIREDQLFGQQ